MGGDMAAAAPLYFPPRRNFGPRITALGIGAKLGVGGTMINGEVSFIFAAACMIGTAAMLLAMITMPL
jgi:hypothetical protein